MQPPRTSTVNIEKDAALERRFQPIQVEEPPQELAVRFSGVRDRYEAHHRVTTITDEAIRDCQGILRHATSLTASPDKAVDLIDEAGARLRIKRMTAPPEIQLLDEKLPVAPAEGRRHQPQGLREGCRPA